MKVSQVKVSPQMLSFLITCLGVLVLALFRIVPHPPNFTPLMATALFGGCYFTDQRYAFLIPLLALFIGDLFLGFHSLILPVYFSFIITIFIGRFLKRKLTIIHTAGAAFLASLQFFIITNFAVWFSLGTYPKTMEGLILCYINGLPYFQNSLAGNIFYTSLIFGSYVLLFRKYPSLRAA